MASGLAAEWPFFVFVKSALVPFAVDPSGTQLFSTAAVLRSLLGCPADVETGDVLGGTRIVSLLLTRRFNATLAGERVHDQIAPAAPKAPRNLSFSQALRTLDRCQRLSGSRCQVQTQRRCDAAVYDFASAVDFRVGATSPPARCLIVSPHPASGRTHLPGASMSSTPVAAVPALAVPTRLSEDERSRHRDDFTLAVIKAHVLDTLEDLARPALPTLLTRGTTILDVGAGGGAIGGYLTRKYGVSVTAYDVVAPAQNVFSCPAASQLHRCSRQPVHVFDGATLPVADRSFDAVLFNSVLHHAAHNASGLLREAARVSSRWVRRYRSIPRL